MNEGGKRGQDRVLDGIRVLDVTQYFSGPLATLFLAVQHPGVDSAKRYKLFGKASTFDDLATRWPDFDPKLPPRPSLVGITRIGGGRIGG